MKSLVPERAVLDGEIVTFGDNGKPSFERLASRIHLSRPLDVQRAAAEIPVAYIVFDILQLGDRDLREVPLVERKAILQQLVPGRGRVRALGHLEGDGRPLFQMCVEQGLEGVVAKRGGGPYRVGPRRYDDWLKIKCERDDDFVVVGWQRKKRSRRLSALILASNRGEELVYRGKVGTGIDDAEQDALLALLAPLETSEQRFVGELSAPPLERHFVEPRIVVCVQFLGWSESGVLRFPVYRGRRVDRDPGDCFAAPATDRLVALPLPEKASSPVAAVVAPARSRLAVMPTRVALTNQSKVFWPEEGYTKGDLCEYYAAVADVMVPFLVGRPVMLVRYPDGIGGKSFYQWRVPKGTPSWFRTLQQRTEERDGKEVTTFFVDSADALVHLANPGCIPIHCLACRENSLEVCDFLTVDFDLGGRPLSEGVRLALSLKDILDELGLTGFPKTSGQTGLHVLIPTGNQGLPFLTAKIFVELLGRLVLCRNSGLASMERRVSERGGKIYVDVGQTGRAWTIVAPYSVRAFPGGRVSTPLRWEELHLALDPQRFTLFTVPRRLAELEDPLAGFAEVDCDMGRAVARLERLLSGQVL